MYVIIFIKLILNASVAQLVEALVLETKGYGCKSHPKHIKLIYNLPEGE